MKLVDADAVLPLTCTREGTCCHGHVIWVNPWEVATLAGGMGLPVREFRQRYLDANGTRLAFDGPPDRRGKSACRLGCTIAKLAVTFPSFPTRIVSVTLRLRP